MMEHSVFAVGIGDATGTVLSANPALARILGMPREDIIGRHIDDLLAGNRDRGYAVETYSRLVEAGSLTTRIEVFHPDGDKSGRWVVWTLTAIPATTTTPVRVLGIGEDVTERRMVNDELRQMALHDPLTGLSNRAGLLDLLGDTDENNQSASDLDGEIGALAYCDLNEFKAINDTYGHSFGDTVLRTVALRFQRCIGPGDHLARIGGDEFVVVSSTPDAEELIANLHLGLRSPVLTPTGQALRVTATIGGTALTRNDTRGIDDLIHDADIDMYRRRGIDVGAQVRRDRPRPDFGVVESLRTDRASKPTVEMLQQIMDAAPDLIFVKDLHGRYVFLNKAAARVKGRPVNEVIGRDDTAFFPPEFAAILQRNDRSIMESGRAVEFIENPVVGGELLTYVSNKAPYFDEHGKVAGIIGVSRNVTAAHATESALRRTQARWQVAIDCSGVGIWDWDVRSGEVFYSPRFAELLGYSDDEIGTSIEEWADRIHPDEVDDCWSHIAAHGGGAGTDFAFEHRLRTKSGDWRGVCCQGRVIERDADGSPLRLVATLSAADIHVQN